MKKCIDRLKELDKYEAKYQTDTETKLTKENFKQQIGLLARLKKMK